MDNLIKTIKENTSDFVWHGLDGPVRITFMGGEGSGHHGHAGRPGSVGGSAPGGYNSPLVTTPISMENIETGLMELKTEHGVIFDPDSRKALYHIVGNQETALKFTKEEQELAKGKIVTHNHPPGGWAPGPSPIDVVFAAQLGVKEMRVVQIDNQGNKWLFRMSDCQGASGPWVKNVKAFREELYETSSSQTKKFIKMVKAGKITGEQGNLAHWNEVWTTISERYGFEYERVQLSG